MSSPSKTQSPVVPIRRDVAQLVLCFWWLTATAAAAWALVNPYAEFLVFGAAASGIVTVPMLRKDYDLIAPWSMAALVVYLGCGLHGAVIASLGSGNPLINTLFLLNQPVGYFVAPNLLYLVGITLMTVAYLRPCVPRLSWRTRWAGRDSLGKHVYLAVTVCALVGFVAFVLYVQRTGGLSSGLWSAKRTAIPDLELSGYQGTHGALRTLNILSSIGFWLLVAQFAHRGVRCPLVSGRGLAVSALFVNAVLLPVYSSTRAEVVYILITAVAIQLCLGRRKAVSRLLAGVGALVLVLLAVLTFARQESQSGDQEFTTSTGLGSLANAVVFSNNFSDMSKMAHIVHAVPEVLPYSHGTTILNFLAAPVPRSLWPEKPLITPGPLVGVKVYGTERAGVPPGAMAEFYWAFGLPGVIVGAWIFGRVLRFVYTELKPDTSPVTALAYSIVAVDFGSSALRGSVGTALLGAVIKLTLVPAVLLVAGAVGRPVRGWRPAVPPSMASADRQDG